MARKKKKNQNRESSPPLPASTPPEAFGPALAPTSSARWQPVVILKEPAAGSRPRGAEVAGCAAADCMAVCCCCPCGLLKLLVVASVRLPAGICRRVRRAIVSRRERARRKRNEARLLGSKEAERARWVASAKGLDWPGKMAAAEVAEKDREMQAWFSNAGFWRSTSQSDERGDAT